MNEAQFPKIKFSSNVDFYDVEPDFQCSLSKHNKRKRLLAIRRLKVAMAYINNCARGIPPMDAAKKAGACFSDAWRWSKILKLFGPGGLVPAAYVMAQREKSLKRIQKASKRVAKVEDYLALFKAGLPKVHACRAVFSNRATMWRWEKIYRERGLYGLLMDDWGLGMLSTLEKLQMSDSDISQVQRFRIEGNTIKESWNLYARQPHALASVKNFMSQRKHLSLPPCFYRVLRTIPFSLRSEVGNGTVFILLPKEMSGMNVELVFEKAA